MTRKSEAFAIDFDTIVARHQAVDAGTGSANNTTTAADGVVTRLPLLVPATIRRVGILGAGNEHIISSTSHGYCLWKFVFAAAWW